LFFKSGERRVRNKKDENPVTTTYNTILKVSGYIGSILNILMKVIEISKRFFSIPV